MYKVIWPIYVCGDMCVYKSNKLNVSFVFEVTYLF